MDRPLMVVATLLDARPNPAGAFYRHSFDENRSRWNGECVNSRSASDMIEPQSLMDDERSPRKRPSLSGRGWGRVEAFECFASLRPGIDRISTFIGARPT